MLAEKGLPALGTCLSTNLLGARQAGHFFFPPLFCPCRHGLGTLSPSVKVSGVMCGAGHSSGLAKACVSVTHFLGYLFSTASSQPGSAISIPIPKQRLGLVRRGSRVEESLSARHLQVRQSDTFTVAEDKDFVVVSIPAVLLLQDQVSVLVALPCFLRGLLLGPEFCWRQN